MALKHVLLTAILYIVSIECEVIYILPLLSRAGCPASESTNYKCMFLSQISNRSIDNISHTCRSDTTLIFLPGKHILTSSLTIKHCSYFTMESSTGTSQRPVISCQLLSSFQFISINSAFINGLKFTGCLQNTVFKADKFTIKDSIFVGKHLLPGRAITVTQSYMHVIRSSFHFFNSPSHQIKKVVQSLYSVILAATSPIATSQTIMHSVEVPSREIGVPL